MWSTFCLLGFRLARQNYKASIDLYPVVMIFSAPRCEVIHGSSRRRTEKTEIVTRMKSFPNRTGFCQNGSRRRGTFILPGGAGNRSESGERFKKISSAETGRKRKPHGRRGRRKRPFRTLLRIFFISGRTAPHSPGAAGIRPRHGIRRAICPAIPDRRRPPCHAN